MHENHFDSTIVSSFFQKVLLFKEFASKFIFYCATIRRRIETRRQFVLNFFLSLTALQNNTIKLWREFQTELNDHFFEIESLTPLLFLSKV